MTATDSLPLHALTEDNLAAASPDLLRAMVKTFTDALMSAEADALCNAEYGQVSGERVNHRNGYRPREWDTRAGTVELAIPKLRQGSYFPAWLLERRRRAEQALISVVATAYLLGVSTRRVEKLAQSLGVTQLSKSQVSAMAKHLDEQVAAFRNRRLDAGRMRSSGSTPSPRRSAKAAGSSTSTRWSRSASTPTGTARSSASTSPPPRTAPAGWPSCAR
jgi:transposase-like protein